MGQSRVFAEHNSEVVADAQGRIAHRSLHEHTERLVPRMYEVADGVWCLVGNGLSNQTFIRAPQGVIAIDTGESVEEMQSAMKQLRLFCQEPVVAVVYTHFHY
ncbi:MAG: MBL fold metallo-hydrolase, partial [Acidimicrobiales bacterium]|nr:MBL fold metallo-hydrolase [Acidimicrobiales bacterium]